MLTTNAAHITPREVARVLFRHRRKMVAFFGAAIALTLLVIALFPRAYLSEAKLLIRVGRESVTLDPTATTGQTISLLKSQVDEVNSALDILSSRVVHQRVVEIVGAERILKGKPAAEPAASESHTRADQFSESVAVLGGWLDTTLQTLRLSDPGTEMDRAVRRLQKGIRVKAPKDATIITVSYHAATPQLAHDVVKAVTSAFLEEHLRLNQVEGSLKFFSEQVETLHGELVAAQTELRDRKNAFHAASLAGKRAIFEEQIKDVELQRLAAQRDLAFSEAKVADLTRAIAGLEPELVTNRVAGVANQAKDIMRDRLYELELQESKLRARYKDGHPLLTEVERQRKQAQQILANVPDDRTHTTSALNPNQSQLELELLQNQALAEAMRARQETSLAQLYELHKQLRELNDQEMQLAELERNVELLEGQYRMHVEKLGEARVNDALGRGGISNIKIAQPATLVNKPELPRKTLILALGLLVAVGGSFGLAFLTEALDQTLSTTAQVERHLGLPVLLSLPWRKRSRRHALAKAPVAAGSNGHSAERSASMRRTYRDLAAEFLATNGHDGGQAKTIGVVGCDNSRVRSRIAADLALQAAECGAGPVLLIDADARGRRVARRFEVDDSPGWREVLAGVADAESCIHRPTGNLAVMAPGATNGLATATSPLVGVLGQLDEIKADYGLVVVDLPPGRELQAPGAPDQWLDEVVLVVEAERTRAQAAQRVKDRLQRAGVRVAGVVLANRRDHIPRWLYQRL